MTTTTVNATTTSDRQVWNNTGNCGGCGTSTCHPDNGCGTVRDDGTLGHTVCSMCPERHEQGLHRRGCRCPDKTPTVHSQVETLPLFPIPTGGAR